MMGKVMGNRNGVVVGDVIVDEIKAEILRQFFGGSPAQINFSPHPGGSGDTLLFTARLPDRGEESGFVYVFELRHYLTREYGGTPGGGQQKWQLTVSPPRYGNPFYATDSSYKGAIRGALAQARATYQELAALV